MKRIKVRLNIYIYMYCNLWVLRCVFCLCDKDLDKENDEKAEELDKETEKEKDLDEDNKGKVQCIYVYWISKCLTCFVFVR